MSKSESETVIVRLRISRKSGGRKVRRRVLTIDDVLVMAHRGALRPLLLRLALPSFRVGAYIIAILGFDYDKEKELRKLKRDIHLKDRDGELFYDKLQFIFLQMPLFKKSVCAVRCNLAALFRDRCQMADIPCALIIRLSISA
jgi:hypothetical protein